MRTSARSPAIGEPAIPRIIRFGLPAATLIRMCGIAAILRTDGGPIPSHWIRALSRGIAWRGPDGSGQLTVEQPGLHAVLLHHRLAIIDLEGGAQPMAINAPNGPSDSDAPPDLVVTFNGCIYNHRALRRELEQRGHGFRSDHSDTEVLLHAYRAFGTDFIKRLEGMYAFALLDVMRRTLITARDPFGEKPLFRSAADLPGGRIEIVGSDPGSISAVMAAALRGDHGANDDAPLRGELRTDPDITARYLLLGYSPGGETFFGPAAAPVREVSPTPVTAANAPPIDDADLRRAPQAWFERAIDASVRARLEADRPTGCFLSGGIDSSLIASFAVKAQRDLPTYCVRMPDPHLDESGYAQQVADHLGTRHVTLDVDEGDPAADLEYLTRCMQSPFGDSSILAAHAVARTASNHIVVALTGDGGDELFFGYDRYRGADVLARHAWWLRALPFDVGRSGNPSGPSVRLGRLAAAARDHNRLGALALEAVFPLNLLQSLLTASCSSIKYPSCEPGGDALRAHDLDCYLPGDLLRKVDAAAMAAGVETRAPFLDRTLAYAAVRHARRELAHDRPKSMLREIAARHLPAATATRSKQGFAVPLARWLRSEGHPLFRLTAETLADPGAFGSLPIRIDTVRRLYTEHLTGRADHAHRLFTLLSLALFRRVATS